MKWVAPVGWVEIYKYVPAYHGRAVLMRLPRPEAGHFVHLALVPLVTGTAPLRPVFLTNGEWEVRSLLNNFFLLLRPPHKLSYYLVVSGSQLMDIVPSLVNM